MSKKVVLCDMDGIMADLSRLIIDTINDKHTEHNVHRDDITDWALHKCLPIGEKVWDYVNEDGFFEKIQPIPGAIPALEQLHDAGVMIVIATSPTRNANSAAEKKRWVAKHLPFIKHRHVMVGSLKHLLKGDFLIDDSPEQQKNYRKAWPDSTILTIKHAFEPSKVVDVVADDYKDPAKAWDVIVKEILARIA